MRILQVNTTDQGGGAAKIASALHAAFAKTGQEAWLAVGLKRSGDSRTLEFPQSHRWGESIWNAWLKLERRVPSAWRIRSGIRVMTSGWQGVHDQLGLEYFGYPGSRRIFRLVDDLQADLVHLHNLHGGYFDLRVLPKLSHRLPVVLTMHDAWMLSGHCAHSMSCDRWLKGCGHCPFLETHVPLKRDASAYNWCRKEKIYGRSSLAVVTPCRWLMDKVERSMLAPAVRMAEVIPNGINVNIFYPGDRLKARKEIGLNEKDFVMLAIAQGGKRNPWKNYEVVSETAEVVAQRNERGGAVLLLVGGDAGTEQRGRLRVESIGYQTSVESLRRYYHAADIYIHMAKADTFPTTILESLACGLPVVAAAVDGIPEQIRHGKTGILVKPGSVSDSVEAILALASNASCQREMSAAAALDACNRFSEEVMVNKYLVFYDNWIRQHRLMLNRSEK